MERTTANVAARTPPSPMRQRGDGNFEFFKFFKSFETTRRPSSPHHRQSHHGIAINDAAVPVVLP